MQVRFNSIYSSNHKSFKGNPVSENINPKTLRQIASDLGFRIHPSAAQADEYVKGLAEATSHNYYYPTSLLETPSSIPLPKIR